MLTENPRVKLLGGALWIAAIAAVFIWAHVNGYGIEQTMRFIYGFVSDNTFGPVVYYVLYLLRPLIFFPAMFLTIMSGSIYGFWFGLALALAGENSSASVAYFIGRFFGGDKMSKSEGKYMKRWRPALEENAVPTVIILRAAYLPFDPVNFVCGLIALPWIKYAVGSVIGLLPPMVTFVSFGSTVKADELLDNLHDFNPESLINGQQLLISIGLLVISLIMVAAIHLYHQKTKNKQS